MSHLCALVYCILLPMLKHRFFKVTINYYYYYYYLHQSVSQLIDYPPHAVPRPQGQGVSLADDKNVTSDLFLS